MCKGVDIDKVYISIVIMSVVSWCSKWIGNGLY